MDTLPIDTLPIDTLPDDATSSLIFVSDTQSKRLHFTETWMQSKFKLYSTKGKEIHSGKIEGTFLELSDLPSGLYLIRVQNTNGLIHVGKILLDD